MTILGGKKVESRVVWRLGRLRVEVVDAVRAGCSGMSGCQLQYLY